MRINFKNIGKLGQQKLKIENLGDLKKVLGDYQDV